MHAYVGHAFAGASGVAMSLTARARQFSCFMVLLGRMVRTLILTLTLTTTTTLTLTLTPTLTTTPTPTLTVTPTLT